MIYNVPRPYEDEIFYSIIARFLEYYSTGNLKGCLTNLFSRNSISATLDFPSGLRGFIENLYGGFLTVEQIINNHTLLPLYSRFLPKRRCSEIIQAMHNKSGDIHTKAGLNAGLYSPLNLPRFCRTCFNEDKHLYGEGYFRRIHQIPSIPICIRHNSYLEEIEPAPDIINKHLFIPASIIDQIPAHDIKLNSDGMVKHIAIETCNLLRSDEVHIYDRDAYFYNIKIKTLGFLKGIKSVDLEMLYESFGHYYSAETLATFRSEIDYNDPSCWLKTIVRKHRKTFDPIRHVLLSEFVQHLEAEYKKGTIVVKRKWPCLNPVCEYFQQKVITRYERKIDPKAGREIKYLECLCGYCYTESYIKEKNVTFRRVKTYGLVWKKELHKLKKKGYSTRKIARLLHCDSKTVKAHLIDSLKQQSNSVLESKKEQWIKLIRNNSKCTITELRRLSPAVYIYVYRRDKFWLFDQGYPKKKPPIATSVDWEKRDCKLLTLIKRKHRYLKMVDLR